MAEDCTTQEEGRCGDDGPLLSRSPPAPFPFLPSQRLLRDLSVVLCQARVGPAKHVRVVRREEYVGVFKVALGREMSGGAGGGGRKNSVGFVGRSDLVLVWVAAIKASSKRGSPESKGKRTWAAGRPGRRCRRAAGGGRPGERPLWRAPAPRSPSRRTPR